MLCLKCCAQSNQPDITNPESCPSPFSLPSILSFSPSHIRSALSAWRQSIAESRREAAAAVAGERVASRGARHIVASSFARFRHGSRIAGRRRRLLERRVTSNRRGAALRTVRRWREWCVTKLRARALLFRAGSVVSRNVLASIEHRWHTHCYSLKLHARNFQWSAVSDYLTGERS